MTTTATNSYNPREHLVQIKDKQGGTKDYYPASWRLYELRLKFPHITIESEIIHMDVERNFVIIKASIFDGKSYEESEMRASALKQGLLSALDKVETAAKARASRDFGISTELALDSEPEEDLDAPTLAPTRKPVPRSIPAGKQSLQLTWSAVYREGAHKGMWTEKDFYAVASALLDGFPVNANNVKGLSQEQLQKLQRDVERYQAEQKAS